MPSHDPEINRRWEEGKSQAGRTVDLQQAQLTTEDGKLLLVLDHDKGRTVLRANLYGPVLAFVPVDDASKGALADLVKDLV